MVWGLGLGRAAWPSGFKPVPLAMDGEGMTPEGLEDVLENWDVEARGGMSRYVFSFLSLVFGFRKGVQEV